jgi:uncharacterized protein YegL
MSLFDTNYKENESAAPAAAQPQATHAQFGQASAIPKSISERHVACVFLLDVSGSMNQNDAIGKLNKGIAGFREHMQNDPKTADVVDVAVVTFGEKVEVAHGFRPVSEMAVPTLTAYGATPLGEALTKGLELIDERKAVYKRSGTPYYRPWVFCITDGTPTDDCHTAAVKLKEEENNKRLLGYCVCTGDGNAPPEIKDIFNPGRIFKLDGMDYSGLFEFVSNSLTAVSKSNPNSESINVDIPRTINLAM